MKLVLFAAAAALAHGQITTTWANKTAVFNNPTMSAEDLKVAHAKWEESMKAPAPLNSTLTCTTDFHSRFPSCVQYQPEWCWATAVTEIWGFFNPETFSHISGGNCHGYECQIAGHVLYPNDPNTCCQSGYLDSCGKRAGYPLDTTGAIQWTTGKTYEYYGQAYNQADLDKVLSWGYPVAIAVTWSNGNGGHMLTLGGCAGSGNYYLHDPSAAEGGQANHFQVLTYQQILQYYPPEGPAGVYGAWHQTFVIQSGETSSVVV